MINGACLIPRTEDELSCRLTEDTQLWDTKYYKVHSTTLMPNIEFEESSVQPKDVDETIFINDEETKSTFQKTIQCQNFISSKYIGRAPLEYYGGNYTKKGTEFVLVCVKGNPNMQYRKFGILDAIRGENKSVNSNSSYGGD